MSTCNVRHYRLNAGMSQDELAAKVGVCKTVISLLENGHVLPTKATMNGLCNVLGCKMNDLYDLRDIDFSDECSMKNRFIISVDEKYMVILGNVLRRSGKKNVEEILENAIAREIAIEKALEIAYNET